jgi:peptidoglycan/xylan/chitin deacetylase (PgdA/CDA1 family)
VDRRTFLAAAAASVVALACSDGGDGTSRSPGTGATGATSTTSTASSPSTVPAPARARFVDAGPTDTSRVALTFHTAGDLELAQQLLDALAGRNTVMTAFVVGEWLDANPSWGPKLLDAGHELANHTYTHPTFASLSADEMRDEVVRCRDVLERVAGTPGDYFRPSGADDGTRAPSDVVLDVAGAAGYATVLGFDVDSLDYTDPGADAVVRRTLDAVRPGSIVSLHFGHPGTVEAIPAIVDGLRAKDLTPVHASQLLE